MSQPAVIAFLSPPDSQRRRDFPSNLFPAADKRYLIALVTLVLDSHSHSHPANVFLRSVLQRGAKAHQGLNCNYRSRRTPDT